VIIINISSAETVLSAIIRKRSSITLEAFAISIIKENTSNALRPHGGMLDAPVGASFLLSTMAPAMNPERKEILTLIVPLQCLIRSV
jgi:hypothetical protein